MKRNIDQFYDYNSNLNKDIYYNIYISLDGVSQIFFAYTSKKILEIHKENKKNNESKINFMSDIIQYSKIKLFKWTDKMGWLNNNNLNSRLLSICIEYKRLDILKYLINIKNCFMRPILTLNACTYDTVDILEWLIKEKCELDPFCYHATIKYGNMDILKSLLKNNILYDFEDRIDDTLLYERRDMYDLLSAHNDYINSIIKKKQKIKKPIKSKQKSKITVKKKHNKK